VCASCNRLDEARYEGWNVAAVAIEKYYDATFRRDRASACGACSSVTARRSYDPGAGFTCTLSCAIGAAVVDDNYFVGKAGRQAFTNHARNWFFLV